MDKIHYGKSRFITQLVYASIEEMQIFRAKKKMVLFSSFAIVKHVHTHAYFAPL